MYLGTQFVLPHVTCIYGYSFFSKTNIMNKREVTGMCFVSNTSVVGEPCLRSYPFSAQELFCGSLDTSCSRCAEKQVVSDPDKLFEVAELLVQK